MENSNLKEFETKYNDEGLAFQRFFLEKILSLKESGYFICKEIAIIGCWGMVKDVIDMLTSINLDVDHILDNDKKKQGFSRCGITVKSVECLASDDFDKIVILVITPIYWKEISIQLNHLGLKENRNYFVINYNEDAVNEKTDYSVIFGNTGWLKQKKWIEAGFQYYSELVCKYPNLPIWLMHQPSIGDLHIFSLFLPYKMGVDSISKCECVLVVTKNSVKRYAEAIGYKYIELISLDRAVRELLTLIRITGGELKIKNAVFHGTTHFFEPLMWHSQLNFLDSFTKFVFNFKNEYNPIYFDLPRRKNIVDDLFKKHSLIPGKTVLISPYAGMFKAEISQEQWAFLVESLFKKGYSVCTNCAGPNEPPLNNTSAPFIELQDCVEFVETAGYFIGIRSGFCDAISNAKCMKIVVCDTSCHHTLPEFFSFKSMGIGKDIIELYNSGFNTKELIQQISEYF